MIENINRYLIFKFTFDLSGKRSELFLSKEGEGIIN